MSSFTLRAKEEHADYRTALLSPRNSVIQKAWFGQGSCAVIYPGTDQILSSQTIFCVVVGSMKALLATFYVLIAQQPVRKKSSSWVYMNHKIGD